MTPTTPATLPEVLARNAAEQGDALAVVTEDRSITHAELDVESRALASRLPTRKSSRVGLLAPNGVDWVVVACAVARTGAVLVPLSTLLRPPELEAQLRSADVTHLVAVREFKGRRFHDEVPAVPSLRAVYPLDDLPTTPTDRSEPVVRPADDLVVLFTSGSTGSPKGVVHTHGSALRACAAAREARGLRPGVRLYMPMPFFWTGGFATALVSSLAAGATLLTEAEPEPGRTLRFLERERCTLFRGWPEQAAALALHPDFATTDLSALSDGSLPALLPAERRPAAGARPNIFGMTESFGPWCGDRLDLDLPADKRGSCGRPFPGVEAQVVDGELQLRGPSILRTIDGRTRTEVFTADGWYPTGDRGRIDDDGYVWFEGRVDDMIKVKGATVYPSEVEVALRALPMVRQAHVAAVGGEVGALVITDASVDEVRSAVKARLSAFKVPTRWRLAAGVGEVPRLASGKVDLQSLRALLEQEDT